MKSAAPYLIVQHSIVGREGLTNFEFDPNEPYRCCLLCGKVYQTAADRALGHFNSPSEVAIAEALKRREAWARNHAKIHKAGEHEELKRSGRFCTPEAALRLVPLGIAPVSDLVLSGEHEHAGLEAPRAPLEDAEDAVPVYKRYKV